MHLYLTYTYPRKQPQLAAPSTAVSLAANLFTDCRPIYALNFYTFPEETMVQICRSVAPCVHVYKSIALSSPVIVTGAWIQPPTEMVVIPCSGLDLLISMPIYSPERSTISNMKGSPSNRMIAAWKCSGSRAPIFWSAGVRCSVATNLMYKAVDPASNITCKRCKKG